MKKNSSNFGYFIPELQEVIVRYGCRLSDKPGYVLLGQFNSAKLGPTMGILAAANNEFHAHILRREIRKGGYCDIEKTEYHPGRSTFSIAGYMKKMRALEAKKKEAE